MTKLSIVLAAAIVGFTSNTAFAQEAKQNDTKSAEGEHKFELAEKYYAECPAATSEEFAAVREKVRAFTDVEIMAETINDPEKLAELTIAINDPHTIRLMASCASEPVMWETWMKNGTDMPKMMTAFTKLMNPAGMMKWMTAPMNPKLMETLSGHLDEKKYVKWATAVSNKSFYSPITNMADAAWYEKRMAWLSDASNFTPVISFATGFMMPPTNPVEDAASTQ